VSEVPLYLHTGVPHRERDLIYRERGERERRDITGYEPFEREVDLAAVTSIDGRSGECRGVEAPARECHERCTSAKKRNVYFRGSVDFRIVDFR